MNFTCDKILRGLNTEHIPPLTGALVRTIATYRDRLTIVLQVCVELQAERGYVRVRDVAERLGISERAARDYLADLYDLGLLRYEGGGLYRVTRHSVGEIVKILESDPVLSFSLEGLIPSSTFEAVKKAGVVKKVSRVLKKLGMYVSKAREIRELLMASEPSELGLSGIIKGDRILYDQSWYEPAFLHGIEIGGEASAYKLANYVIRDIVPLSVSYVASCALYTSYEWNMIRKSEYFLRPKIQPYSGSEPYDEDLFHELATEYPELLIFGRRLASRLLKEIQRYRACLDLIEQTDVDIIFTKGSLIPHGFILTKECKTLNRLQVRVKTLFQELMRRATAEEVIVVGVTEDPRDMRLTAILEDVIKLGNSRVSDYAFLRMVMHDGDVTAPMLIEHERGKEIENCYEFYLCAHNDILKFEYVCHKDPVESQRRILEIASSLISPSPFANEKEHNISVIFEARMRCRNYIAFIKKMIEAALRIACVSFVENLERKLGGESS